MNTEIAFEIIAGICGLIIFILLMKKNAQFVLNFLVRAVLGAIAILFFNDLLENQGINLIVGLNPISLLTTGTLGFPGLALLYGISATKFL